MSTSNINDPQLRARCKSLIEELVAMDTSEDGSGLVPCVERISDTLTEANFAVTLIEEAGEPPMVIARRKALCGGAGRVLIYNHYDVDAPEHDWHTDPFMLTEQNERWRGLGIGDNKGALGARLAALPLFAEFSPELVWVIQGQEESGSALARRWFRDSCDEPFDMWIEENGWSDADGTQRVLAVRGHTARDHAKLSESQRQRLLASLGAGPPRRLEDRVMNKSLVPGGCPFQHALPVGSLYVAIGTNDAKTRIHAPNESISAQAPARHAHEFAALLHAVAQGGLL